MPGFPIKAGNVVEIPQVIATQKQAVGTTSTAVQLDADSVYRVIADVQVFIKQGSDNTTTATTNDCLVDALQEFYFHTHNGKNWLAFIGNSAGNIYITKVA